jgi:hypothetical protein
MLAFCVVHEEKQKLGLAEDFDIEFRLRLVNSGESG